MFNETPVVGGPLGFVAVDWHLDAVHSVWGSGLSLQLWGQKQLFQSGSGRACKFSS